MAAFTVIDHTEIGSSGAASWAVSSISSSYDHLLIKVSERNSSSGGGGRYPTLRLGNSGVDSGSNYSTTYIFARTSTPTSGRSSGSTYVPLYYGCDDGQTAGTFSSCEIWIPNYSNTSNFKATVSKIAGPTASSSDYWWGIGIHAGLWHSTSAVTDVEITAWNPSSNEHMQYSSFTLYGVTGA
jgi:hypothetical protein